MVNDRPPALVLDVARRWWPVPLAIAASLVAQQALLKSRYDVSGHAAEHLDSATAPFLAFACVVALLTVTPKARRQPVVLLAAAAWFASTIPVLVGNVRVVDALIRTGNAHIGTSELGDDASIAAAHGLADAAPWLGVLAAMAVAVTLWRCGHVGATPAIVVGVLSVIFPPWIIPGAGVPVLVVVRAIAFDRESRSARRWPKTAAPVPTRA
jgi:hypothetical protein